MRALPAPSAKPDRFDSILFDFDESDVRASETDKVATVVRWAEAHPTFEFVLDGNADERGTEPYNTKLSGRRARGATRDALVRGGVDANRIRTLALGEEAPVCNEKTERCYPGQPPGRVFTRPMNERLSGTNERFSGR